MADDGDCQRPGAHDGITAQGTPALGDAADEQLEPVKDGFTGEVTRPFPIPVDALLSDNLAVHAVDAAKKVIDGYGPDVPKPQIWGMTPAGPPGNYAMYDRPTCGSQLMSGSFRKTTRSRAAGSARCKSCSRKRTRKLGRICLNR